MEVVAYEPAWLGQLAALARVHGRLAPPGLVVEDEEVERGLGRHAYWPFYSPGMSSAETLLAVDGEQLLAAAQVGFVGHGWGYGAAPGDGPDWLYDVHLSLFWLMAWPAWYASLEAAAQLAAHTVSAARSQGLPGVEAFRGGPGFLPFGTQLSTRWPHLRQPLRAAGFRQPRDLVVYAGDTDPASLPPTPEAAAEIELRPRRGGIEGWLEGEPVGVCGATPLARESIADPRAREWAVIRRLYVDPAVREQGVGTALFAAQLKRLHDRGVRRWLLHIPDSADEVAAHALYAKFGGVADRQQVLRVSF